MLPAIFAIALWAFALGCIRAQSAANIKDYCQRSTTSHCVYTPVRVLVPPMTKVDRGAILASSNDGDGSMSFLINDQSTVEFTVFCSDGGSNTIILDVSQKKSSATVDKTLNGGAKVYFNDNPNAKAAVGQTIRSTTAGVDASILCP